MDFECHLECQCKKNIWTLIELVKHTRRKKAFLFVRKTRKWDSEIDPYNRCTKSSISTPEASLCKLFLSMTSKWWVILGVHNESRVDYLFLLTSNKFWMDTVIIANFFTLWDEYLTCIKTEDTWEKKFWEVLFYRFDHFSRHTKDLCCFGRTDIIFWLITSRKICIVLSARQRTPKSMRWSHIAFLFGLWVVLLNKSKLFSKNN